MTNRMGTKAAFRNTFRAMLCALALLWPGVATVVRADDYRIQQVRERYERLRGDYEAAKNAHQRERDAYRVAKNDLDGARVKRLAAPGKVKQLKRDLEQQTQNLDDNITRVKIDIKMARRSLENSTIESNRERYRQQIRDAELNLRILERQRARIVAGLAGPLREAQANVERAINDYYDALHAAHARYRVYQPAHRRVVEVRQKLEETRLELNALLKARRG